MLLSSALLRRAPWLLSGSGELRSRRLRSASGSPWEVVAPMAEPHAAIVCRRERGAPMSRWSPGVEANRHEADTDVQGASVQERAGPQTRLAPGVRGR